MADGIMNKDQLLSLTLRQLRQEASKLTVPLYSRKTKAVLVDLILKYQKKNSKSISVNTVKAKTEDKISSKISTIVKLLKQMLFSYLETQIGLMFFGKFLMQIEKKHNH